MVLVASCGTIPPTVETSVPRPWKRAPRTWKPEEPDRGNQKMKSRREQTTERLAVGLKKLEQSWQGKPVGIGFDADLESGRITLTIGPEGQTFNLVVSADVDDVRIGSGERN